MATGQQASYFLELSGASGESQESGFTEKIAIKRWQFVGTASSTVAQTQGSGGGKATLHPLELEADMDASFTKIAKLMTEGQHIATVKLTGIKLSGASSGKEYLTITLKQVYVSQLHLEGQSESPVMNMTLTYKSIKTDYKKQSGSGSLENTSPHTYDNASGETK